VDRWDKLETNEGVLQLLTPTQCVKDRLTGFYPANDRQTLDQAVAVFIKRSVKLREIEIWSREERSIEKFHEFSEAASRTHQGAWMRSAQPAREAARIGTTWPKSWTSTDRTVDYQSTDGRFVTSINSSHKLAPGHPGERIESGGISRMADYSGVMTVRQLVDLVAFLHSRYELVPRSTH
jgi:hypothetical protein